ncbi:hypothetical protein ACOQFO_06720 [Ureibacillus sp. MALMAid1270]|uniref:hypothetical protein n=1 Tax=Ureibacillus sp. MALMAid1270 TaxID=3411629 RepID=UPI003BA42F27
MSLTIKPSNYWCGIPNVSISEGNIHVNAFYDPNAKQRERITNLPGSILTDKVQCNNLWLSNDIAWLESNGYIKIEKFGLRVLKPICGSPSGTAVFVLGEYGPRKPNGNKLWKYYGGKSIK